MKSKKILTILISALLTFGLCLTGLACGCVDPENPPSGDQKAITMAISASAEKLTVKLNSSEAEVGNKTAKVIGVKAYEYFKGDNIKGLSENVVSNIGEGTIVGDYKLGTEATLEIDRYKDNFDMIYNKYYVVLDDTILKGPIYTTEIEAQVKNNPTLDLKSKKGLLGENANYFEDLNCSYATLNFDIERLVYPNEIIDENGEAIELAHPDSDFITFDSNGKTYYFRKSVVDWFDKQVNDYYRLGAHVTAILYAAKNTNEEIFPRKLTYYPWSTEGTVLMGFNSSNSYGFEYYVAIIEFLSNRYTTNNFANGYIGNFVVENEIDYAKDYNRMSEKQLPLETYMEEYSRLLRLTNLAAKKYHKDITVSVPFTQAWSEPGYTIKPATAVQAYAPKAMIEWLNNKTKAEGDYDWAIAPHCYTYGLAPAEIFLQDTLNGRKVGMSNDYNTSTKLTFSNLEILDMYLNQPELKYNNTVRKVYLTESGVSSLNDTELDRNQQAGAIAATWYKITQLDSVVAWYYYRLYDHEAEVGASLRPGLIDISRNTKPSYNVYKYIDTQYSNYVAKDYLKYLSYADEENKIHSVANGNVNSYMDFLNVFNTSYNFGEFNWQKATPVVADTVYEFEDKIDLSSVKFESKNFLYDGTEKAIAATGIPNDVTVSYDVAPTLTEVGSKTIVATFKKNNEVVGHRSAKIAVSKVATNKTVYNFGEKVFVTTNRTAEVLDSQAWIGIFRKGAIPGNTSNGDISYFYYYFNNMDDKLNRTVCLQDQIKNTTLDYLPVGDYVIYYFFNSEYDYKYTCEIKVLQSGQNSGLVDLTNITFEDEEIVATGEIINLQVKGELPNGVNLTYVNNENSETGVYEVCAIFTLNGVELERRYAVLTILPSNFKKLMLDKTTFYEGEEIWVTATADKNSKDQQWWVGLYLKDDEVEAQTAIYWYYVKDAAHVSGGRYNIILQTKSVDRVDLFNLPAGQYKMVLFNTSGYTVEQQIDFEIIENQASDEKGTISTNKTKYAVGEDILVTATRPENQFSTFWVGLYLKGDIIGLGRMTSIYYYYVVDNNHVSGTAYNIKEQTSATDRGDLVNLPAGKYKLILFNTSGYSIESQIEIQIGEDSEQPTIGTLSVIKTEYSVGEAILVTATSETSGAWVGVYKATDNLSTADSISYYNVADVGSGVEKKWQINLPAGEYVLVLYKDGKYTIDQTINITIA